MIDFAADTAAAMPYWRRICFWYVVRGMLSARIRHEGHMNERGVVRDGFDRICSNRTCEERVLLSRGFMVERETDEVRNAMEEPAESRDSKY
jgi:hypothetical protein